jgi:sulfite oxidase
MLSELDVNAVICTPEPHAILLAGSTDVRGYALAGGDHTVARVDLSIDGGTTWTQAQLEGDEQPSTWRLWHAQLDLQPGEHEIIVRAVDSGANTQPADVGDVWNFKGYMNNAWHRVMVHIAR